MNPNDPYAELAEVYDDWQYLYPQPFCLALRPRVLAAVREFSVPVEIYADLGCGTGTFAAWWKDRFRDWRVFGLDASPAMIDRARSTATRGQQKRALMQWGLSARSLRASSFEEMMAAAEAMQAEAAAGEPDRPADPRTGGTDEVPESPGREGAATPEESRSGVEFHVQALGAIALPVPIGLATCLFDGMNHLLRPDDLRDALRSIRDALAPGGLFIFDLVDESVFEEAFDGAVVRKGPGLVVTAESIHFRRGGALFGRTEFAVFREEGRSWRRYDAEISERCWDRTEMRRELVDSGLAVLREDQIDPAVEREFQLPRTFWICRRPID